MLTYFHASLILVELLIALKIEAIPSLETYALNSDHNEGVANSIPGSLSREGTKTFIAPTLSAYEPESENLIAQSEFLSNVYGINHTTHVHPEIFYSFHKEADNDPQKAYFLGLLYLYGLYPNAEKSSEGERHQSATHYVSLSSHLGFGVAQCSYGLVYYIGLGTTVQKNLEKAILWFRNASLQKNVPRCDWLLAKALFDEWNNQEGANVSESNSLYVPSEVVELLNRAVQSQILEAIHFLGVLYEYGLVAGVQQTETRKEAAHLYGMAASMDYAESMYHFALMYMYGRGIRKNSVIAGEYFRRAAENHQHVPSMRYLGMLAAMGIGNFEPEYSQALGWFDKCQRSSHPFFANVCKQDIQDLQKMLSRSYSHTSLRSLVDS